MLLLQHSVVREKVNQARQYSVLLSWVAEILCTNDNFCLPISFSAGMPHP